MKVKDLLIKQFNNELKDKTVFRVLNQEGHDKYIYNIDKQKFNRYKDCEDLFVSLIIDKNSIEWEIEIIEKDKPIEKLDYEINENNVDTCTEKIRCKINELIDKVNKLHEESRKDGEV